MSDQSLTDSLNSEQRAAVLHYEGPALVLAGAGSGKTRVLIHRIAMLLTHDVPSSHILALTFTNKAAKEMRERVDHVIRAKSLSTTALTLTTFHAFGATYLREHAEVLGRTQGFIIYDKDDQQKLLKDIIAQHHLSLDHDELLDLYEAIQHAKHNGRGAVGAECSSLASRYALNVGDIGRLYDQALKRSDAFDFGDLIVCPLQLLQDPERRRRARARWRWLLVDEFQDTNHAQLMLLQALCASDGNLFVVGDDDQSIYAWRGANVDNILKFTQHFPDAQTFKLQQNYRSKGNILNAANHVIQYNLGRLGKTLWTEQEKGSRITLYKGSSEYDEAYYVAHKIKELTQSGRYQYSQIALLYRANYLTLTFEKIFHRDDVSVPYMIIRGLSFFERAEVKDAIAYLRLLINPWDQIAFQRALFNPSRGAGKKTFQHIMELSSQLNVHFFEASLEAISRGLVKGRPKKALTQFYQLYTQGEYITKESMTEQAEALLSQSGLYDINRLNDLTDETRRAKMENILHLIDNIKDFEEQHPDPSWFGYLEQLRLMTEGEANTEDKEGGKVSLMTVHAAKGLEFPIVFVVGLEEDLFPNSSRSQTPTELEEERRLFYVAVTRAEEQLTLTYTHHRSLFGQAPRLREPSRFIKEIDPRLIHHVNRSGVNTWRQNSRARQQKREHQRSLPSYSASGSASDSTAGSASDLTGKTAPKTAPKKNMQVTHRGVTYSVGQQVRHRTFGDGLLLSINRRGVRWNARVRFTKQDKTILLEFLTPLSSPLSS